jgi:membrane protein YdbS with pleckstrin-like domain
MNIDDDVLVDDGEPSFVDVIEPSENASWRLGSMGWKPEEILRWHLLPGETVIYRDSPSVNALLLEQAWFLVLALVASLVALVYGLVSRAFITLGLALIAAGAFMLFLLIDRVRSQYTMYVLTSARVMRLSGVVNLKAAWIPWGKVTDVRLERSLLGRLFKYATVHIDSANEKSGLESMKNLSDPKAFYLKLSAMVQLKQGNEMASEVVDWDHPGPTQSSRRIRQIMRQGQLQSD